MDKIYSANVGTTAPTPGTANGYPQDGNPSGGVAPTIPGAYWFWMITSELLNLIVGAGLTPDGSTLNQVFTAVTDIATSLANAAVTTATSTVLGWFTGTHQNVTVALGFQDLPGGMTWQWVQQAAASVGSSDVVIVYKKSFTGVAPLPQVTIYDPSLAGGSSNFLGFAVSNFTLTGCTVSFGPNGGAGRNITVRVDVMGNT